MQLVQVQNVCDQCYVDDGRRVDVAETVTVGFGTGRYELDLCTVHAETFNQFQSFTESHGRQLKRRHRERATATPRESQPATDDSAFCPECGKRCASQQGLTAHRRIGHGAVHRVGCPECGKVCAGLTGLQTHRRAMHGVKVSQIETEQAAVEPAEQQRIPVEVSA